MPSFTARIRVPASAPRSTPSCWWLRPRRRRTRPKCRHTVPPSRGHSRSGAVVPSAIALPAASTHSSRGGSDKRREAAARVPSPSAAARSAASPLGCGTRRGPAQKPRNRPRRMHRIGPAGSHSVGRGVSIVGSAIEVGADEAGTDASLSSARALVAVLAHNVPATQSATTDFVICATVAHFPATRQTGCRGHRFCESLRTTQSRRRLKD